MGYTYLKLLLQVVVSILTINLWRVLQCSKHTCKPWQILFRMCTCYSKDPTWGGLRHGS